VGETSGRTLLDGNLFGGVRRMLWYSLLMGGWLVDSDT
jgi:hypothetical protein